MRLKLQVPREVVDVPARDLELQLVPLLAGGVDAGTGQVGKGDRDAVPEVDASERLGHDRSQAQELASYGWLVRNVVVSGHWWYDTMPAYIERDLAARLQSVPKTKLLGYYTDMYKLEFGLAKLNMYRRSLARVLARDFIESGRGSEQEAVATARLLLRENPQRVFGV